MALVRAIYSTKTAWRLGIFALALAFSAVPLGAGAEGDGAPIEGVESVLEQVREALDQSDLDRAAALLAQARALGASDARVMAMETDYRNQRYAQANARRAAEAAQRAAVKDMTRITAPDQVARIAAAKAVARALGDPRAMDWRAGETFGDGEGLPTMVVIPAGSFLMGSPPEEAERYDDEGPQRRMTLDRPFALSAREVTFAQWDACVADGGCQHRPDDMGWGRGDRPVVNVSWDDIQAYLQWINVQTGGGYGLPSEAQWEYAARAGTTTPFYTGEQITTDQANFDGEATYGGSALGLDRRQTVPVGSFDANPWGLYDMHGNVWEWTQDCWTDTLDTHAADGSANLGGDCRWRVARGGSWFDYPLYLRLALRNWDPADHRTFDQGFRLFKEL